MAMAGIDFDTFNTKRHDIAFFEVPKLYLGIIKAGLCRRAATPSKFYFSILFKMELFPPWIW